MNQANPFIYATDNKRYHTWNYHLREHFGHKVFKVAWMAVLTVRTVMAPSHMAAVPSAVPQALVTLRATGLNPSTSSLRRSANGCIINGKMENIWPISKRSRIRMHPWQSFARNMKVY